MLVCPHEHATHFKIIPSLFKAFLRLELLEEVMISSTFGFRLWSIQSNTKVKIMLLDLQIESVIVQYKLHGKDTTTIHEALLSISRSNFEKLWHNFNWIRLLSYYYLSVRLGSSMKLGSSQCGCGVHW